MREQHTPYNNETLVIPAQGKNYAVRVFTVDPSWQTDSRLIGTIIVTQESLWVPQAKVIRLLILDLDNYNNYANGAAYTALYQSGPIATLGYDVPLKTSDHQELTYILVLQNPQNETITLTHSAGINFEKTFQGYSYTQWISRGSIAALLIVFVYWRIRSRPK